MNNFEIYLLLIGLLGPGLNSYKSAQQFDDKMEIVFLINDDPLNYEATTTIPDFAKDLENELACNTTILISSGPNNRSTFSDVEAIRDADLLVVFCRRIAIPVDQMELIKNHYRKGKPILGIRSANHAFSVRDSVPEGFADWWEFVPKVLGCENRGHEPNPEPVRVLPSRKFPSHPLAQKIHFKSWTSTGYLYQSYPLLDENAEVVIEGKSGARTEPMAWTRITPYNGKVFYSALGENEDFSQPQFKTLLINAVRWCISPGDS